MKSQPMTFLRITIASLLLLVNTSIFAQPFSADIRRFREADKAARPPANAVLLIGSSSFTKWTDVQAYFPGTPVINRGFGGSTLPDVIRYVDDVVFPYHPKQIFIYCGENDLASSDSVSGKMVYDRFQTLYKLIRAKLPAVPVVFISLKPSPSRARLFPKMEQANKLIAAYLAKQKNARFLDVYHLMLNAEGKPMPEIFLGDSLHMNAKGYAIWQKAMEPVFLFDPMNKFIADLMSKMTVEEKIGQLNLLTPGGAVTGSIVSQGVNDKIKKGQVGGLFGQGSAAGLRQAQEIAVNQSRLHIPLIFGLDVIHGYKSVYPIPLGLSASWDTALIAKAARLAATEAAADGVDWTYSPMVDIARDSRWGRVSEGNGEDPVLGSAIAAAMVRGYQGNDLTAPDALMACVKHFALYGAAEAGREYNTVDMSRIRMYQDYLPPYKAAIDAGAGSVMSSFNEIDGIPATGNKWLLTDLLRDQWGFKGFVVSDYTSLGEMINHGIGDLKTVSANALNAGLDMDMVTEGFLSTLGEALKENKVSQAQIDSACRRILEAKYKLGLFENPYRRMDVARAQKTIFSEANRKLARTIAEHSFVLLKNADHALPLKKGARIALIGPLGNSRRNMLGTWSVSGDHSKSVTLLEGFKAAGANVAYAKGANISDDTEFVKRVNVFGPEIEPETRTPQQLLDEALKTAAGADIVVAAVGEAADMSGESSSRADIGIPESQENLLKALAKTGKPVVLVLFNGRAITLPWEDANMTAILDVWFAGTESGNAVADVLFGHYNPSGKLSLTFPRSVGQIPLYYNHKNTGRPFHDGDAPKFKSDYLDISNDPLYPFGYGLSYTSFAYDGLVLSSPTIAIDKPVTVTVEVANAGDYDGEETVQLYVQDIYASVTRPVKELKKFQKVWLKKGEKKTVTFTLSVDDLRFYASDLSYIFEPGDFNVFVGGNSRDVLTAKLKL